MSGHTPGPWSFTTSPQPNGCPTIGARGLMVAVVTHSVNQADQKETAISNARLIAAAPELLDALRDLFNDYKSLADSGDAGNWRLEDYPEGQKAMDAIARATGAEV